MKASVFYREVTLGSVSITLEAGGVLAVQLGVRAKPVEHPSGDAQTNLLLQQVVAVLEGDVLVLPLRLKGSPWQLQVWRALLDIPRGQAWTYGQLAGFLGRPTAARAVARACASNQLAVLVPCHRVIARDGNLSGYRWGLDVKKQLLQREGVIPA